MNRQSNMAKWKGTNNGRQKPTQKTKNWAIRPQENSNETNMLQSTNYHTTTAPEG
jgi:hypothetical protein